MLPPNWAWGDYTKAAEESEDDGPFVYTYHCQCRYVRGQPTCPTHGDYAPRYPPPKKDPLT